MQYLDLRLAHALREDQLREAEQARRARAIRRYRIREQLGRQLIVLGERLERHEARAA